MQTNLTLSEDEMWQAFTNKDAAYDGRFFVAVRTTGIYCRPSCPAKPARKNVAFFADCDSAEAAGYRACKRCHPRELLLPAEALAQDTVRWIEQHGHARLSELGSAMNVSPFHLQRTFKRVMGLSPLEYAKSLRVQRLKTALRGPDAQPTRSTDAIYEAGFNTASRAYEQLDAIGMTPSAYQKGGRGMAIAYGLVDCSLGRMLIAGTPRGLCAVYFGNDDAELERELRDEYPAAHIERHSEGTWMTWAQAIAQYLLGAQPYHSLQKLPLDVQGTAFQARVWQALRQIPPGQTRSYADIAQAIGQPSATRAVANACGANRVGLVIPCHRVVRENGDTGGYRWGIARKEALLVAEHR
ncbi:MAG: bifunctional DNA-binding transcriptional regulator/O6-methylguanine-DNA methyltransferase Ada [Anaerolineae bacterium]|nr:bifunctional DNA-binding transcriptional regulator/O6-methylguanine-DNA methyltransferase Ada [Anaerolineae bacterium]